ncbi:MAG: hypothetical protein ACFCUU_12200 [Cyclobacteriaceae bacterium]
MKNIVDYSRRAFIKSSAMLTTGIVGATAVSACQSQTNLEQKPFRQFLKNTTEPIQGITGLLFSQIGYELGLPVRVIFRLPKRELLSENIECRLINVDVTYTAPLNYWGEIWGSHWWVAELKDVNKEGTYNIEVLEGKALVFADEGLEVKKNIFWDKTIEYASVDMLERRAHFTKVGAGWQDAGVLWVESCAQSGMIISLEDLLEKSVNRFDQVFIDRLEKQITVGCDYLVMTQKKAKELGYADGAFTHDLHGHEHDILPNDANKAVVALVRAHRLLSNKYADKKNIYLETAKKAYQWLLLEAKPMGSHGFQVFQRGIPLDTEIPKDEWVTRDLVMMCWASIEMWKVDQSEATKKNCIDYAKKIMDRQIEKNQSENGFYGHFYEFSSLKHSESAWIHGIVPADDGVEFGTDMGGFYPNYLMPIIEMLQLWPKHEDAKKWKTMLSDFANGYLKPACLANPFKLVPLGIYADEGPIWFCGTFHGSNAIYGFTAALALELASVLHDNDLIDIAYSNLLWVAGLNGGITDEGLKKGCVIFSADVPKGIALPASMICQIGNRWAGTWFQTRGVVCNGFSVGEQFKYDTATKKDNDGPHSFTDEDWIPHSAGWITGLIRLNPVIEKLKYPL